MPSERSAVSSAFASGSATLYPSWCADMWLNTFLEGRSKYKVRWFAIAMATAQPILEYVGGIWVNYSTVFFVCKVCSCVTAEWELLSCSIRSINSPVHHYRQRNAGLVFLWIMLLCTIGSLPGMISRSTMRTSTRAWGEWCWMQRRGRRAKKSSCQHIAATLRYVNRV